MWKVDLRERLATHKSGFCIQGNGGRFSIINGKDDDPLFEEGKLWFLHYYSKDYILFAQNNFGLSVKEIAKITQKEIDEKPNENFGYEIITEEKLIDYLSDEQPLFSIKLCSLIRKAVYFQLKK